MPGDQKRTRPCRSAVVTTNKRDAWSGPSQEVPPTRWATQRGCTFALEPCPPLSGHPGRFPQNPAVPALPLRLEPLTSGLPLIERVDTAFRSQENPTSALLRGEGQTHGGPAGCAVSPSRPPCTVGPQEWVEAGSHGHSFIPGSPGARWAAGPSHTTVFSFLSPDKTLLGPFGYFPKKMCATGLKPSR